MSSQRPSFPPAATGTSASITFRCRRIRCWASSQVWNKSCGADQRASPYLAMSQGAHAGRLLLAEYREDLKKAIFQLASALQPFDDNGLTALLCDVTAPRSAATDTRAERRRFVTNACVYATFMRGIRLGVIDRIELEAAARTRTPAIQEGAAGAVRQAWLYQACLARRQRAAGVFHCARFRQRAPGILGSERRGRTRAVRGHDGLILGEPRFRIPGTSHFLVSADNPQNKMIHKIAAPAYQGRSCWPTFNVEFADRMLEYDEFPAPTNTGPAPAGY